MTSYNEFLERKIPKAQLNGFEPVQEINPLLFDWQRICVEWALRRGRCALFEECGLGKTPQQLEWGWQVHLKTLEPVLIVCPLAVAQQTVEEGQKFGYAVNLCRQAEDLKAGINITNVDRIGLFDGIDFSGVVIDESSILKSFTGVTRRRLIEQFSRTPYRLCCTATPAPNDFTELGQHADFLGICTPAEMLATYFINDTFDTGTWRLKGHAEDEFWRWVSSWAICISKPSDLGFSDEGFNLPPVDTQIVTVKVDHRGAPGSGQLFRVGDLSATEIHSENRRTLKERCDGAAAIVNASDEPFVIWCELNEESGLLASLIPGSVEVRGSDTPDLKERKLRDFQTGKAIRIITKPSITGFGLNWQHCHQDLYVGLNHSWERFYQGGKRIHRFGQKKTVKRYIIQTDLEDGMLANLTRKQGQHDEMHELTRFTREQLVGGNTSISIMKTDLGFEEGKDWRLVHGDCVRACGTIESDSVGFSIFSPPFADLFTCSSDVQDMGNCRGLDDFMEQFGYLIDELGRVTMPGRECAVHCCDLLATKWKDGAIEFKDFSGAISTAFRSRGWMFHSRITIWKSPVTEMQRTKAHGLLYKTLQSDSANSRVGAADYLLVFRKRGVNPKPITQNPAGFPLSLWQEIASPVWMTVDQGKVLNRKGSNEAKDERHICPLQLDVINRALMLWSAKDDLVFSPFTGIGSEGYCALQMFRRFVGAELKQSYFDTACDNLRRAEAERETLFLDRAN